MRRGRSIVLIFTALLPFACGGSTEQSHGKADGGGQSGSDASTSGGSGGASGGAGGSDASAGAAGTAGAAGGNDLLDACTVGAKVFCAKLSTCLPALAPMLVPASDCVAVLVASCLHDFTLPGTHMVVGQMLDCTAKVESASCDELFYGGGSLLEPVVGCGGAGDYPAKATCSSGAQCASLACVVSTDGCGKCSPGLGEPCTSSCGVSALCLGGVCVSPKQLGEPCTSSDECGASLACSGGTCVKAPGANQPCIDYRCDFYQGVMCAAGLCLPIQFPTTGQDCSPSSPFCDHAASCVITSSASTCQARPAKGEACSDSGPYCLEPYFCVDGICDFRDSTTCP